MFRSPLRFALILFLGLAAAPTRGAELGFFSPDFSAASTETLKDRLRTLPADSVPAALARLFLADQEAAHGEIHAGLADYRRVVATCADWEAADYRGLESGLAAMICALAQTEVIARGSVIDRWRFGDALRRSRMRAFTGKSVADDRLYFEGRLFAALPPAMGQDFKKALLSLRFLQPLHPDDGSVAYWTARAFERQGNAERAKELFQSAVARRFPAAVAMAERADGLRFGWGVGVFGSPASGVGGGVDWYDARIFDTARAVSLGAYATTRGQLGVRGRFVDESSLAPARWQLSGWFRDGIEDFYGLGIGSAADSPASFSVKRSALTLGAAVDLASAISFSLGWRLTGAERTDLSGPALAFGYRNGPVASLAYDSRDSLLDPSSGGWLAVEGYFPGKDLREWRANAGWVWPLALRHQLQARAGAVFIDGSAPFSEYADLAPDTGIPGVREFRYRDRNLLGGAVEYQWRWAAFASAGAFVSVGTSAADAGSILSSTTKAGGGLAWIGHLGRDRSATPRLELANFGGEWVLQGAVRSYF